MRVALFAALILVSSPGHALTVSCSVQVVGFAALSITKDQGVRAIVSNVGAAPCPVQVSFFGTDGSLIGNATTVQLKAGGVDFRIGVTASKTGACDCGH